MKKLTAILLILTLLGGFALATEQTPPEQPPLEIWAQFTDNQKALYSIWNDIEEDIDTIFEYLCCVEMADGSREIVDLLFIIAPEAEDGAYVLDLAEGEFYDHINQKKMGEFKDRAHVVNTLINSWSCGNTEFLWTDSEIKLFMTAEEIQAVRDAAVN